MSEPAPRAAASPGLADRLADPIVEMHVAWETTTIQFLADRLGAGIDRDDWPQRRAVDLAQVRRDLDRTVARLAEVAGAEIQDAITEAYRRGNGAPPLPARERQLSGGLLDRLRQMWAALTGSVARLWNRAVAAGTRTDPAGRRASVQRVLDRAADRGIEVFRDARGRIVTVGPWVQETVQTSAGNAAMDGFVDRLTVSGDDLVRVTRSPHPCPVCEPWEDRVLSISGMSSQYPGLAEARAAGLWHPRCRHTIQRYRRGERFLHEIDHQPGTYDEEQQQRYLERGIRKWKRRRAAALPGDPAAAAYANRKVRAWEAAMRHHLAATGLRRSRQRERIDFGHSRPLRHALGRAEP